MDEEVKVLEGESVENPVEVSVEVPANSDSVVA